MINEIERLIVKGYITKEISDKIGRSRYDVSYDIRKLKKKYNARNIAHLSHLITIEHYGNTDRGNI